MNVKHSSSSSVLRSSRVDVGDRTKPSRCTERDRENEGTSPVAMKMKSMKKGEWKETKERM